MIIVKCDLSCDKNEWKCDVHVAECYKTVEDSVVMVEGQEVELNRGSLSIGKNGFGFSNIIVLKEHCNDYIERYELINEDISSFLSDTASKLATLKRSVEEDKNSVRNFGSRYVKYINRIDLNNLNDKICDKVKVYVHS